MKQALSVEQMKHLEDLGVNTSDANMCWMKDSEENRFLSVNDEYCYEMYHLSPVPAYTLQDILDKLPCFIGKEVLTMQKLADSYTCLYMESYTRSMINITESKELIDAAYEMLCWCIENGYVKVENEQVKRIY